MHRMLLRAPTALALALALLHPAAALASDTSARAEIIGALPDVFFTPGTPATRTIQYHYKNLPHGSRTNGIWARSITPGIRVRATYGSDELGDPFEWMPIGPATPAPYTKTWTLTIEADGTTPAGTVGRVEVVQSMANDVSPVTPRLIGTVNVHVTDDDYDPTFSVTADGSNMLGSLLALSHPLLDGNPQARVIVTPSYNPGGGGGLVVRHPVEVRYVGWWLNRWFISLADGTAMPEGASFNVHVDPAAHVHQARTTNTSGSGTTLHHPVANDNPYAILLATNRNEGVANPHPVGVRYSSSNGRWSVYNTDGAAMPVGARFNVEVVGYGLYFHEYGSSGSSLSNGAAADLGSAERTRYSYREIRYSHASEPDDLVFVTANATPKGASRSGDPNDLGVFYTSSSTFTGWAIYNQNGAWMDDDAGFSIWVPPAPIRGNVLFPPCCVAQLRAAP